MASVPFLVATFGPISSTGPISFSGYFPNYFSVDAMQKDDLMVVMIQTANEALPSTPAGWSAIVANGVGSSGGSGSTLLTILYKIIDPAIDLSITIPDSGDHQVVQIAVFRGVHPTNPLDGGVFNTGGPSTSFTFPANSTTYNNCLALYIMANGINGSGQTTTYSTATEILDYNMTHGVGGGISAATLLVPTAGTVPSVSGTLSYSALQSFGVINLRPRTDAKIYSGTKDLSLQTKLNILKSSKAGTRVSTVVENFDNTPPVSSSGTPNWNSNQAILTNVSGKWKLEANSSGAYSSNITRSFVFNKYEQLSFDYTTVNTGGTVITVSINIVTDTGTFYEVYTLPANSSGTATYNINELRNTRATSFVESEVSIQFRLQGTPIGSGSYLLLDNLSGTYNQQNILLAESLPLSLGSNNAGLYNNKTVLASTSALNSTYLPAGLYSRKAIIANNSSIIIGNPDANLKSSRMLISDSNSLAVTLTSNTMYKGMGITASNSAITMSLKAATFFRQYKIIADTKSLLLTLPDTNTVIYTSSNDFVITMVPPTLEIIVPPHIQVPTLEINVTPTAGFYYFYTITFTGSPVPSTHVKDSKQLEADAIVDLFEIALAQNAGTLYLKMNKTVEWQGNIYEGTGIKIDGVAAYADDEVARPKLSIWNPEGVFSYLVDQGILEGSTVSRIRVLKHDIENNLPVFRRERWKLSRVVSLSKASIVCELRDMMDGQNFLTPGRMFIPPEFKTVSLS